MIYFLFNPNGWFYNDKKVNNFRQITHLTLFTPNILYIDTNLIVIQNECAKMNCQLCTRLWVLICFRQKISSILKFHNTTKIEKDPQTFL